MGLTSIVPAGGRLPGGQRPTQLRARTFRWRGRENAAHLANHATDDPFPCAVTGRRSPASDFSRKCPRATQQDEAVPIPTAHRGLNRSRDINWRAASIATS